MLQKVVLQLPRSLVLWVEVDYKGQLRTLPIFSPTTCQFEKSQVRHYRARCVVFEILGVGVPSRSHGKVGKWCGNCTVSTIRYMK